MSDDMEEQAAGVEDESPPKPKSAKPYLAAIKQAEKAFEQYQAKSDNIDKLYANLEKQANPTRDREFAMFWANIQVLLPSTYSRPPVPVCVPRFKDRKPVPRATSEFLERATVVAFEMEDIDQIMRLIRDDLGVLSRGVAWCRFEKKDGYTREKVCIDWKHRKDFLHDPARCWKEVGWVAGAAYLSKDEMRKRYRKTSGDVYKDAQYSVQKEDRDNGAADNRQKAKVWEIWHKLENKVIWVTEGVDLVLDEGEPHLELEGFFPCPRPAYGTVQRGSLVPVPDFVFYKDQLEEINELTARISALAEAVKVRGFYPAGAGEIGDAIETALKSVSNNQVMVPISNWAAFGTGSAKDSIVWLPVEGIVKTIVALVELRKQLIDDVYQITGLSDIMRGATDPDETLGAQQLKSQFGSIRVRDKQNELVRIARDIARIAAEIMAENFSPKTLLEMTQMELPTDADIEQQEQDIIAQAQAQVQQAMQNPQMREQAQQNPQMAEQMLDQLEQQTVAQIEKLRQKPTLEKVMALLREEKLRPYILEIETDSTIYPDENAEKQMRAEFLTALGGTIQQVSALVAAEPGAADFAGEIVKFAITPFRAGREMDAAVDDFIDQMKARSGQPQTDPAAEAKAREIEGKIEIERAKVEGKMQADKNATDAKMAEIQAEMQREAQKHAQEMEKGQLEIQKLREQVEAIRIKAGVDVRKAQIEEASTVRKAEIDADSSERQAAIQERSAEQQARIQSESAQQQADIREREASQRADQSERDFANKSALADRQAAMKEKI